MSAVHIQLCPHVNFASGYGLEEKENPADFLLDILNDSQSAIGEFISIVGVAYLLTHPLAHMQLFTGELPANTSPKISWT